MDDFRCVLVEHLGARLANVENLTTSAASTTSHPAENENPDTNQQQRKYYPVEDGVHVVDHRLINPRIILESVKEIYLSGGEGCLSVDEHHDGYVYRHNKIQVKAYNVQTQKEEIITARGYEAIVLQHEIDHLNGILYYDHINKKDPFMEKEDAIRL